MVESFLVCKEIAFLLCCSDMAVFIFQTLLADILRLYWKSAQLMPHLLFSLISRSFLAHRTVSFFFLEHWAQSSNVADSWNGSSAKRPRRTRNPVLEGAESLKVNLPPHHPQLQENKYFSLILTNFCDHFGSNYRYIKLWQISLLFTGWKVRINLFFKVSYFFLKLTNCKKQSKLKKISLLLCNPLL